MEEYEALDPVGSEAVPSDDVKVRLRVSAPLWTAAALVCLRPFSCCLFLGAALRVVC